MGSQCAKRRSKRLRGLSHLFSQPLCEVLKILQWIYRGSEGNEFK